MAYFVVLENVLPAKENNPISIGTFSDFGFMISAVKSRIKKLEEDDEEEGIFDRLVELINKMKSDSYSRIRVDYSKGWKLHEWNFDHWNIEIHEEHFYTIYATELDSFDF